MASDSSLRQRVLVVGGGTMGQGIALACALAGHECVVSDLAAVLPRVRQGVDQFLAGRLEKGKLGRDEHADVSARLRVEEGLAAASSADWVIEAIVESLEPKRKLFAELEERKKRGALLCSNTSSLGISAIAAGLRDPAAVLGLHFFNPAPAMQLVEVVRTGFTEQPTIDAALAFVRSLGKKPVVVKDTPGFVVNRVARSFTLESLRVLTEGIATPGQVDRVMRLGAGFKMGPFELMDLIGIDINLAVTKSVYQAFFDEPRFRPSVVQQEMVDAGRLGRKTGRGFYAYDRKEGGK
jgi:3-hydroxybutyryl-CoA dehydrogenase